MLRLLALILALLCSKLEGGHIVIPNPSEIDETKLIDNYIPSSAVIVGGHTLGTELFESHAEFLREIIVPYQGAMISMEPRGIPPSNWAKIKRSDGTYAALFSYKSVHRCRERGMPGSTIVDAISVLQLREYFQDKPQFYMSRTGIAEKLSIHTVTTLASEIYSIQKSFANFTSLPGAHSDVRIIRFSESCPTLTRGPYSTATYVVTGSVHDRNWTERQFLAILDGAFGILKSWILNDPDTEKSLSRPQKNWLPFWDVKGCKLLLSKRFGPEHVVGEFTHWRSSEEMVDIATLIVSPSPARVSSEYFIRGGAPPVVHPFLEPGYVVGCVHMRGKLKVYRHALYVMESKYPYNIVSFSPLFAFKPYRDIEFVMSVNVMEDGSLELSHGSMDCEPRLAVYNVTMFRKDFAEYMRLSLK